MAIPDGALHINIEGLEHLLYVDDTGMVTLHRYAKKRLLFQHKNNKAGRLRAQAYMEGFERGVKQKPLDC